MIKRPPEPPTPNNIKGRDGANFNVNHTRIHGNALPEEVPEAHPLNAVLPTLSKDKTIKPEKPSTVNDVKAIYLNTLESRHHPHNGAKHRPSGYAHFIGLTIDKTPGAADPVVDFESTNEAKPQHITRRKNRTTVKPLARGLKSPEN